MHYHLLSENRGWHAVEVHSSGICLHANSFILSDLCNRAHLYNYTNLYIIWYFCPLFIRLGSVFFYYYFLNQCSFCWSPFIHVDYIDHGWAFVILIIEGNFEGSYWKLDVLNFSHQFEEVGWFWWMMVLQWICPLIVLQRSLHSVFWTR